MKIAKSTREFIYKTKFLREIVTAISKTSQLKVSLQRSRKVPNSKKVRKSSHTMKKREMIVRNNHLIRTKRILYRQCAKITIQVRTLF